MKIHLTTLVFLCYLGICLHAQKQHQLSLTAGSARSIFSDQLWGYQTYQGWNTNYELAYGWGKSKRNNQFRISFAQGDIAVRNSLRQRTLDLHFDISYHHLRPIKTWNKSQILWEMGAGLSTFLDLRIQDQFSSNNFAAYNLGLGLQWQNQFSRTFIRKNKRPLHLSFLIENTLLSALMVPNYASTNPEKALDINGLNDLSLGGVIERMKIVSFPKFWRVNLHTVLDFEATKKFGWRAQYVWSIVHSRQRLKFTGARHQLLAGCFFKF